MKFWYFLFFILTLISCVDITAYQAEVLNFREEKNVYLKNFKDSPLPDSLKRNFVSLNYYPPDEKWINQAVFQKMEDSTSAKKAGFLIFRIGDKEHKMQVEWSDSTKKDMLFFAFKDQSNGKETYQGGRYLNIPYSSDTLIKIDFNYAYNPFCVYNEHYVCPIPPAENLFSSEIQAGEKLWKP